MTFFSYFYENNIFGKKKNHFNKKIAADIVLKVIDFKAVNHQKHI